MLAAAFAAFLGGQLFLGRHGTDLSATGALRAIVGGSLSASLSLLVLLGWVAVALAGAALLVARRDA